MNKQQIAKMIDHAILHPTQGRYALIEECKIANEYGVASVCVKPYAVKEAAELLKHSDVMVGTVIGFPHGNSSIEIKVAEAKQACDDGAVEIDMVINNGKVTDQDWDYIYKEISDVNTVVMKKGFIVKVIFETAYLSNETIIKLCNLCTIAKVSFVKTSTGFGYVKNINGKHEALGATCEHIKLMRDNTPLEIKVKASGGIRSLNDIKELYKLGATRFGTSSTKQILENMTVNGEY